MARIKPYDSVVVLLYVTLSVALFAAVVPVAAVDGQADYVSESQACEGELVHSSVPHATGCLEALGITKAQAATAFLVDQPVERVSMAWALVNTARVVGIDIPPVFDGSYIPGSFRQKGWSIDESQLIFEDLDYQHCALCSGYEAHQVVNELVELGITKGKTSTTFDPTGTVTRAQMAVFFTRLLELLPVSDSNLQLSDVEPDDTVFTDISNLSEEAQRAIGVIYELGITFGTTSETYSPNEPVTGGQMALFLVRLLSHTSARGKGGVTYLNLFTLASRTLKDLEAAIETFNDNNDARWQTIMEAEAELDAAIASSTDQAIVETSKALESANKAYNVAYSDCLWFNIRHQNEEEAACIDERGRSAANARSDAFWSLLALLQETSDPIIRAILDDPDTFLTHGSGAGINGYFTTFGLHLASLDYIEERDYVDMFDGMDVLRALGINQIDEEYLKTFRDQELGIQWLRSRGRSSWPFQYPDGLPRAIDQMQDALENLTSLK